MLPPHDDANLHGLVPLLRKQFAVDRHRMIQIWAGLAELSCCELGVFTHEIAETKAFNAQHLARIRGVQVVFFMERLPSTTLVRKR